MRDRGRRRKNQGFSLVELLVSITVLAMIVVPLLNSFITAAKTNAKAKHVLEATTGGQNLMEQIKADGVEAFVEGAVQVPLVDEAGNAVSDAEGRPYVRYEKALSLTVNGHSYRAVASLSPAAYLGIGNDGSKNYNSTEIPRLADMHARVSAFLIMEKGDDLRAVQKLNPEAYGDRDQRAGYLASIRREIQLSVTKDDTGMIHVRGSLLYYDGEGNALSPYYEHELYTGAALENVFLCFTPLSDLESGICPGEAIRIENEHDLPLRIYLVRQDSDAQKENAEYLRQNYRVEVCVSEGAGAADALAGSRLITNLLAGGTPIESQIQLTYQNKGGAVSGSEAWDALRMNRDGVLTDAASRNMIYDIEIRVYQDGETTNGEAIAVLTGTTTE